MFASQHRAKQSINLNPERVKPLLQIEDLRKFKKAISSNRTASMVSTSTINIPKGGPLKFMVTLYCLTKKLYPIHCFLITRRGGLKITAYMQCKSAE